MLLSYKNMIDCVNRGHSTVAVRLPSKQDTRVRIPLPALRKKKKPPVEFHRGLCRPDRTPPEKCYMLPGMPRATVVGIPAAPQVFLSPAGSTGARSAPTWLLPGPALIVASPHGEAFFRTALCPPSASWIARLILGEYSLSLDFATPKC